MTARKNGGNRLTFWAGVLLAVLYGVRAVIGLVGGLAYAEGRQEAGQGDYFRAGPFLEFAVGGHDPAALHWLRGQVRQGLWRRIAEQTGRSDETDRLLREAFDDYARAIVTSPASGWYWSNLAEIYQEVEQIERIEFPVSLDLTLGGPWEHIGRPGRVAIGLSRAAVLREPGSYILHDRVADVLFEDGLEDLALEAVRTSARVQPIFYLHPYRYMNPLPSGLLDAFAEASREALDSTPLLRTGVHLVALGRLEARRENWQQAVDDLSAALDLPGHDLDRAEAWYWLGYALGELGRYDDAVESLERSREHPNMETRALETLAVLAEREGDLTEAVRLRRLLHQADRRNLTWVLDYARVARREGSHEAAEDALRWGVIVHPEESRLHVELIGLYIDRGDLAEARRELSELERFEEAAELVEVLRERVQRAAATNPRDRPRS